MGTMPLITEREIVAAHVFPAADGTHGAYFKLDSHGTNLVAQHTTAQRGSFLFTMINGRRAIDLYVDRPVTDGVLSIPKGLSEAEANMISLAFKPMLAGASATPAARR